MLGIMAVMDQKDFYMLVVGPGSGMCKYGFAGLRVGAPRAVLRLVLRPLMLRITAGMDQVCLRIQCSAWFDCGYMRCVSL